MYTKNVTVAMLETNKPALRKAQHAKFMLITVKRETGIRMPIL
jgi:hypothetical protein